MLELVVGTSYNGFIVLRCFAKRRQTNLEKLLFVIRRDDAIHLRF